MQATTVFQRTLEKRARPAAPWPQKLLGAPDKRAFVTELGNHLRDLGDLSQLDLKAVEAMRLRFKIKGPKQARAEVMRLVFSIGERLVPGDFLDGAVDSISAVGAALELPADQIGRVISDAAERCYREAVRAALSDDVLTDAEKNDLDTLEAKAGLSETTATAILSDAIRERLNAEITTALSDEEYTPEEEAKLNALAVGLGAKISMDAKTQQLADAARRLWQVKSGPLVPVESPLLLRKGETAYAVHDAEAVETRSRTTRYTYGGPSVRIRIMKGVSYRVGSASVSRTTEEYSHSFGKGVLVLTDKRVMFRAAEKTISINHPKVVDYELFRDGVKIYKETGKPLTFILARDDMAFAHLYARLVTA